MTPRTVEYIAWVVWYVSWGLAALWATPAAKRPGLRAQWPNLTVTTVGAAMLFLPAGRGGVLTLRLWQASGVPAWSCVGVTILGFSFCWWARGHLGALWSGTVTIKRDHRLVDSGPYGLVRHPIYTGILAAAVGLVGLGGAPSGLLGLVLVTLGFAMKARLEEDILKSALGAAAYDAYAARTPMLIPWPWRALKRRSDP